MTKDNMTSFNFKNMDVRVITKNNDPWFVLVDVCKILEIKNSREVSSKLNKDEKDYIGITDACGRIQETTIINESGLYSLILCSRKPEAKRFKKWVTSEVLPSLNHKPILGYKDMLNNSILFDFENTSIRVFSINDEAWFSASDVAKALGYSNPLKAVRDHCKGVNKTVTPSAGGKQTINIIPERDVYRLVMRSKLPSAEQFEEKVVSEVLPSIRKTGGYMVSIPNETPEQILSRALLLAKDTMDRQTQEIAELKPKADGYDLIATSNGSMCITDTAKYLQIRPKELFDYLKT